MDHQIENMVLSCYSCGIVRQSPKKAVLCPLPTSNEPWERIHADFLGPFLGHQFLIIVDAYSKWVEIYKMQNITTSSTIEKFYDAFSRFGLPKTQW